MTTDRIKELEAENAVLRAELRFYCTRDADPLDGPGACLSPLLPINRRVLHTRALLGLGHLAMDDGSDPLGTRFNTPEQAAAYERAQGEVDGIHG